MSTLRLSIMIFTLFVIMANSPRPIFRDQSLRVISNMPKIYEKMAIDYIGEPLDPNEFSAFVEGFKAAKQLAVDIMQDADYIDPLPSEFKQKIFKLGEEEVK